MMTRREKNIVSCCNLIDLLAQAYIDGVFTKELLISRLRKQTHSIRRKIWRGKKKDMLTKEEKIKIFKLMALKEIERRGLLK